MVTHSMEYEVLMVIASKSIPTLHGESLAGRQLPRNRQCHLRRRVTISSDFHGSKSDGVVGRDADSWRPDRQVSTHETHKPANYSKAIQGWIALLSALWARPHSSQSLSFTTLFNSSFCHTVALLTSTTPSNDFYHTPHSQQGRQTTRKTKKRTADTHLTANRIGSILFTHHR